MISVTRFSDLIHRTESATTQIENQRAKQQEQIYILDFQIFPEMKNIRTLIFFVQQIFEFLQTEKENQSNLKEELPTSEL